MNYFDISPLIDSTLAVFPGDTPFHQQFSKHYSKADNYALSSITTTVHIGAHTDAPHHYHPNGTTIDKRSLDFYYGKAQVIRVKAKPAPYRLTPSDIENIAITAPRILFHTGSFPDPYQWRDDFTALSPELIDFLATQQVKLIGIDTPSVDPASDPALLSHHAIFKHDMAILEGIVLETVPAGCYHLVALPLRIKDADASPVRAILIAEKS